MSDPVVVVGDDLPFVTGWGRGVGDGVGGGYHT